MNHISLEHGGGGTLTASLIKELFYKNFSNAYLLEANDSARLPQVRGRLAFTTDSYVVSPLFFPGGNIGKLAICGTINDLAMSGARPLYLSCGFILEAGLPLPQLEQVVGAMAEAARGAGVLVVTGDTTGVEKGAVDQIFINTAGIGQIEDGVDIGGHRATVDDIVIVSGTLGDHGLTIMLERHKLGLQSSLQSDCAPLHDLVQTMLAVCNDIRVLRDPTRGGVAAALNEIAAQSKVAIELYEENIPVDREVRALCEVLGLDPLHLANEGKLIAVVPAPAASAILTAMHRHPAGRSAAIIGRIAGRPPGRVYLRTLAGGRRLVDRADAEALPRIC